jgi:hypothetical protein
LLKNVAPSPGGIALSMVGAGGAAPCRCAAACGRPACVARHPTPDCPAGICVPERTQPNMSGHSTCLSPFDQCHQLH